MARTVETVGGAVDADRLGRTLGHEHVFIRSLEIERNYGTWDHDARVADAAAKLQGIVDAGFSTIVDPTCIGLGRDVATVQAVAAQVPDLHVVVATGLYTYDTVPHHLHYVGPDTLLGGDEPMVAWFVRDLTEGIADTGVRAGILKCASDQPGITPDVQRVIRAVAAAHRETGAPIWTHSAAALRQGLDQQRILAEEGVDLSRVVIGHAGDTDDLDYLEQVIEAGSTLGMDRFGLDLFLPFEQRVATVAALCGRGYADRMLLSHDVSCHIDWLPEQAIPQVAPNWHHRHIPDDVLPALRERGVTDDQIDTMLVEVPKRLLVGA